MVRIHRYLTLISFLLLCHNVLASVPIFLSTWDDSEWMATVWDTLDGQSITAKDAVTLACSICDEQQCRNAVGFGSNPDENGETTLDSMIFDGATMNMGAVGGLRRIKDAAKVARHVLDHTKHSLLSGDLATEFAKVFNYKEENLTTEFSLNQYTMWRANNCQPNFWLDVTPDPAANCGPYSPTGFCSSTQGPRVSETSHDTIGVIAIDASGDVAAGTTTNGLINKIPGRVGDSPLPGAGAYADNRVGAAVATGDGDIMMRFLPTFLAVEEMRRAATALEAARTAAARIREFYPDFWGAVLVTSKEGDYGAACNGMETFPFCVGNKEEGKVVVKTINCGAE